MIRPLVSGLAPEDLLATMAGIDRFDLQAHARSVVVSEAAWGHGLVAGSALPPVALPVDVAAVIAAIPALAPPGPGLEVAFGVDPRVQDGRWLRNTWLQELPDPVTQVAWGNVARIGPLTARELGVVDGDVVAMMKENRELRIPAVVLAGHAEGVVTADIGYGPTIGADVDVLRTAASPWREHGVALAVVGHTTLAFGQDTTARESRPVARDVRLADVGAMAPQVEPPKVWREHPARWGMAIDLSVCNGCNACAIACQAENNVPTVGPTDLAKGRRMHWLRIDRYGDDRGHLTFQPMLCQHCEDAPCEYVCPVYATEHSADGLNEQVYNRCVGTRFCSENCPYKVRRFNWFHYTERRSERARLQWNPDVTVRDRGVIEKCTFCVQRIREGERTARVEHRELRDGEVVTACAQACPTDAIVFGPIEGRVGALQVNARAYSELGELGTHPVVRYLAAVENPPEPS